MMLLIPSCYLIRSTASEPAAYHDARYVLSGAMMTTEEGERAATTVVEVTGGGVVGGITVVESTSDVTTSLEGVSVISLTLVEGGRVTVAITEGLIEAETGVSKDLVVLSLVEGVAATVWCSVTVTTPD